MKKIIVIVVLILSFNAKVFSQTSNWNFLGPIAFPENLTGQINGIGRVCQLKFAPHDSNTVFACSASGGLWKSINQGQSWALLGTDMLPKMATSSICVDHTNPDIIYLSSGDPNYYGADLGIWKSTDGGNTWSLSNTTIGTRMALELLMDPTDHLSLIAATNDGIWKTTDGGISWAVKLAGNQFTDMKWMPDSTSSIVYASSLNKFFRSVDKGDTWTEVTSGFNGLLNNGTRLATSATTPGLVYVGTVFDEGTIFKSVDSGQTFTIQYHNPLNSLTGYDTTGGGQGNYNFCIEANPSNPDQLFLGSHNIWRSDDGGVTWSKLTQWWKTVHTDMHDYIFQPGNPTKLFQANDGGVWLTEDAGVNWTPQSDGLGATENYHAAASPLYSGLISTGTQDNGELVHIDGEWKTNRGGDWTTKMLMDYSPQKFVYYFDDIERRALPSGGGKAYEVPATISASLLRHVFSPDDQDLAYVCGSSIWQTKNNTNASPIWTQLTSGSAAIRSMAVCAGHPNIFAYSVSSKLYISHDALSPSPTFTNNGFPTTGTATDIAISSIDTNTIYVIINNKVYKSVDGGINYNNITGTLPNTQHFNLFLDKYSSNESLYLGNALGVYYTNNTLTDWVNYSAGLPTICSIKDIMCFNDGGVDARLFISYFGRGTWETKLENSHTCITPVISSSQWNGAGFQVTWNGGASSNFQIQYREIGSIDWTTNSTSVSNYSINSFAGCSKYEVRVRGLCPGDTSLWSNRIEFETPTNNLNQDFDGHQDIGQVGATGSVCFDSINSRYTILASGEDIWNNDDEFHFLYKKVVGDVTISARVKHIGNIYGWAKGGVMIRETLDSNSKQAMCALTPGNGFAMQWRANTSGGSANKDTSGSEPGWVKLERIGNDITSYFSVDGVNWNELNTATIAMSDTVYIGLANCSHIDSTLNDAVFDHINLNGIVLNNTDVVKDNSNIKIYPNPATQIITIETTEFKKQINFTIIDVTGKQLIKKEFRNTSKSQLDISNLPSGMYFLEINDGKTHVTNIIKQ